MSSLLVEDDKDTVTVEAADVIRLILGYLTSQGLHESARVLRTESGIGYPSHALLTPTLGSHIQRGEWGSVLSALALYQSPFPAPILEQVILELAETGGSNGLAIAQQLLAVSRQELDAVLEPDDTSNTANNQNNNKNNNTTTTTTTTGTMTKARSLEQRLAALAATPHKYASMAAKHELLFGPPNQQQSSSSSSSHGLAQDGQSIKQRRRDELAANLLASTIPVPLNRLSTLIHQAIKWQAWTGQLPMVQDDDDDNDDTNDNNNNTNNNQKKKKKKRKKKRKHYDLVLGRVMSNHGTGMVGDESDPLDSAEPIPSQKVATIKFGKSVLCQTVATVRNGLITASSDGFIEIWELGGSSYQLNTTDYAYQAQDQVMGHDDGPVLALSVSRDQTLLASGDSRGIVKIWNLKTGTCLRHYQAHPTTSSITALDWSPDGSKLLVASSQGLCREFGIVSQHVLQEYVGHFSYIHSCVYSIQPEGQHFSIMTSSADGTVRLWEKHGHCRAIWQPPTVNQSNTTTNNTNNAAILVGSSIVVDATSVQTECPSIVAACPVPSALSHTVVVPRSSTAFLVDNNNGIIVQQYSIPPTTTTTRNEDIVFCAATVTADWVYLCTTGNDCLVFAINTNNNGNSSSDGAGPLRVVQTIPGFGIDSTTPTTSNQVAEISQLIPHPHKPILFAFSNDKTQKKGILAVWK